MGHGAESSLQQVAECTLRQAHFSDGATEVQRVQQAGHSHRKGLFSLTKNHLFSKLNPWTASPFAENLPSLGPSCTTPWKGGSIFILAESSKAPK